MRIIEDLSDGQKEEISDWQEPIHFKENELPDFNTDIFPEWLRNYIEEVAEATQTPTDASGMVTISILSSILSKKFYIKITPQWSEPLNSYVILALPPGNRKSAVFKLLTAPVTNFEKEEQDKILVELREKEAILKAKKKRLELLQKKFGDTGDRSMLNEISCLEKEIRADRLPTIPRYITGDITAEKLGVLLSENKEKIAVLSAEGGGVFNNMAGRYSSDGKTNLEIYLNGHTGDYTPIDRIGREPILLHSPCLTIGLFVQPSVVRDFPCAFKDRGLMQRFIYSFPESLVGYRKVNPEPINEGVKEEYQMNLKKMLAFNPKAEIELTFSKEAMLFEQDMRMEIEEMLKESGTLHEMKEWGSKLAGQIIRIAGLLHVATYINGDLSNLPKKVNLDTIRRAKKLMNYFVEHARLAYGLMGKDQGLEDAKYLLKFLLNHGKEVYSKREVFQGTKGTFKYVARFESAVIELEERNLIKRQITNSSGKGRKSYKIFVNPKVTIPNIHNNYKSQLS
ncbi:YfjI family protein [Halobacillus salinarum]|uniref:YfjI family protein n=1 Tax=Halobacillus salinarum TaxID=2932257 RepID=A0ABY4EKL0_9BACI|nr:YfjI family protein [Halobacillus salinarum]UOQ44577.1 YfjI family protein [Halobacillus salinarum]